MGSIFIKTLIMFALAFIISMFVALLIYWIRRLLTSVRMNSLFDDKAKILVKRAIRIHKIHDNSLALISDNLEHEMHPELFDYYDGVNEEFREPQDFHGALKPVARRKRSVKKHKNI
jgi:hypothetical protein